ncbi:Clavaminate synthase-like protein [Massarina eburnea CBS 473.64]|uniref:Clavaminate synthase-like protein n=1 Tax=Massarina eburnea CBS 473.64 TaxID=1395130 RepID=A0A6A6S5E7_9PLEO|nr:Clavaminate synthase-like protein [Massarina eburnea CBS 473.64]
MASNMEELYSSFPDDVPTAPLVTISLQKLVAEDGKEKERLFEASKSLGFFYLDMQECDHGKTLLSGSEEMFDLMERFYELPVEEKLKYDFAAEGKYFGYIGLGAEVVDGKGTREKNEKYNISKDDILSQSDPLPAPSIITNNRPALSNYIHANNRVLTTLFSSLAESLNLPASTFTSLHRLSSPSGCHIRFIRAPPQPIDQRTLTLGEHTDFGSLTILFNRIGGLQVKLPNTTDWVYVRPMPGCAIVNLGDAMVKFTAGILRSNLHRVVSPPGSQADMVRYSLVFFQRPEYDVKMRRLEGGLVDGVPKDDGEVDGESTREWLKRRHQGRKGFTMLMNLISRVSPRTFASTFLAVIESLYQENKKQWITSVIVKNLIKLFLRYLHLSRYCSWPHH